MDLFQEVPSQEAFKQRNGMILENLRSSFPYTGGCSMRTNYDADGFGEQVIFGCMYLTADKVIPIVDEISSIIGMPSLTGTLVDIKGARSYDVVRLMTMAHVALHANDKSDIMYIDILSCKPFDRLKVKEILTAYGVKQKTIQRISRGVKVANN